jgi:hypothetical protein
MPSLFISFTKEGEIPVYCMYDMNRLFKTNSFCNSVQYNVGRGWDKVLCYTYYIFTYYVCIKEKVM